MGSPEMLKREDQRTSSWPEGSSLRLSSFRGFRGTPGTREWHLVRLQKQRRFEPYYSLPPEGTIWFDIRGLICDGLIYWSGSFVIVFTFSIFMFKTFHVYMCNARIYWFSWVQTDRFITKRSMFLTFSKKFHISLGDYSKLSGIILLESPSAVALGQLVRSGSGKLASLRGCRGLRLCSVSQKWKGKSRFHISLISQQVCYLGYVCAQGAARAVFLSFLWSPLWQLRTK